MIPADFIAHRALCEIPRPITLPPARFPAGRANPEKRIGNCRPSSNEIRVNHTLSPRLICVKKPFFPATTRDPIQAIAFMNPPAGTAPRLPHRFMRIWLNEVDADAVPVLAAIAK